MNEIVKFDYNGQFVRCVLVGGEPWFILADLCAVFDMETNRGHSLAKRLDTDTRNLIALTDTMGRRRNLIAVNESGLYNIILRSDKPQAKPFQNWVTKEVLPTLRKTGKYEIVKREPNSTQQANSFDLTAEINHLSELHRVWLKCADKPYSRSILGAISEIAKDIAYTADNI